MLSPPFWLRCCIGFAGVSTIAHGATDFSSVVIIESFRAGSTQPVRQGLGFVAEANGFLITTYENLIDPTTGQLLDDIRASVRTGEDGSRASFDAAIIGVEPTINLGILKIEAGRDLTPAPISREHGLSSMLEIVGVTIGSGRALAAQPGHVVAMNTKECYQESLTSTMVRAAIELPANGAGGPVFDSDGFIVAIFTGYRPTADGAHEENANEIHLLPVVLANNIYDSIKTKRSLRSPWTGFSVRPLRDDESASLATRRRFRTGIGIEFVWKNSPAEKLGIQPGDVLVQFAFYPITSVADFQKWLYMYGVGQAVKLTLLRGGSTLVIDYVIEERPAWARPQ